MQARVIDFNAWPTRIFLNRYGNYHCNILQHPCDFELFVDWLSSLDQTSITNDGLLHLAGLSRLEKLSVSWTHKKVTEVGLGWLNQNVITITSYQCH
jgi:hypothetical protein